MEQYVLEPDWVFEAVLTSIFDSLKRPNNNISADIHYLSTKLSIRIPYFKGL